MVRRLESPCPPEGYAYEPCGLCKGVHKIHFYAPDPCQTCRGTGKVLVLQPSVKCPRCKGSGEPSLGDFNLAPVCVICRGAGWAMALPQRDDKR